MAGFAIAAEPSAQIVDGLFELRNLLGDLAGFSEIFCLGIFQRRSIWRGGEISLRLRYELF